MMQIVIAKDLRKHFGPARDQDPRPTCMAFAASDTHAAARPGWEPLSAEWAYYHALKKDGGQPLDGITMASVLETLRNDGQPVEVAWPYIQKLFTDLLAWNPPKCAPLFRRDSVYKKASINEIITSIDAEEPVLFTMSISDGFYVPDSDGVISVSEPLDTKRIHALVAVGHGSCGQDSFILVRNSWGDTWGINGYAWVSSEYLKPRLIGTAIMTIEL